jgi:signal transduction histidine kinase
VLATAAANREIDGGDIVPFRSGAAGLLSRRPINGTRPDIADAASRLTSQRYDILCQLLRAAGETERSAFKPIWAFENVERAGLIIRLLLSLDRLRKSGSPQMLSLDMERDAADRLSAGLRLLRDLSPAIRVPCSAVVRDIARDLVELFGPTVGEVSVAMRIEPLTMTNVKRRALVLIVCNLLLHAIAEGYPGRAAGRLIVSLRRSGEFDARLSVADDGYGGDREWAPSASAAIGDLAAVLEGRLLCRRDAGGGCVVEVTFPRVA